jgi:hypothetical protein
MVSDWRSGRAQPPIRLAARPFNHAGGCQVVGSGLVVGVEDDNARDQSVLQLWDLRRQPHHLSALDIVRRGPPKVSTAGAVGLTAYRGGVLMAVVTWDASTIDFYTAPDDPFALATRFSLVAKWTAAAADRGRWIDHNWGRYQALNLVTQWDGTVWMVAFNRNDEDEDWMDLYFVDVSRPAPTMVTKMAKRQMTCASGCSFRHGAGIFTPSADRFEVYAVNGFSGDHATGTTIHLNHFD